jgi:hypothetical protein
MHQEAQEIRADHWRGSWMKEKNRPAIAYFLESEMMMMIHEYIKRQDENKVLLQIFCVQMYT